MPDTARELFESELKRSNEEGQKLIADLLKGDVDAFINAKRSALVADINAMYTSSGDRAGNGGCHRAGRRESEGPTDQGAVGDFMPKLSYSMVGFVRTNNALVSPWGQAFSLLVDIAAFPRKVLTDGFFLRGLKVSEDDLIEAMNVADDALCRDLRVRGIKDRCKAELDLLSRSRRLRWRPGTVASLCGGSSSGEPIDAIDEALKEKEAA